MINKPTSDKEEYQRKRVLLVAYACSPYIVSEPMVGWNRAFETAKFFDTWVICKKQKYEDDIRRYFSKNGEIKNLKFCFVPRTRLEKILKKTPGMWYAAYNLWHRRAYRAAVNLHKEFRFHIIHHVNMSSFREPGYLWKIKAPFIIGPVGGSQNYPWRFIPHAGIEGAIIEGCRTLLNILQFRFSFRVRMAARKAVVLLTANSDGKRAYNLIHNVRPVLMLETGVIDIKDRSIERIEHQGPLRILWSGVLKHHKALHLLIRALSEVPEKVRYELRILGTGPLGKRWRRLARQTDIERHCTWMGWLPHAQAMDQIDWADVFVFTSLRDTSGNVVLEAMSRGVPIVCLDHQGVRDIVTNECGIKIAVTTPSDAISKLQDAIVYLADNRSILCKLSHGALERSQNYLWSHHGKRMAEIYEDVITTYKENISEG